MPFGPGLAHCREELPAATDKVIDGDEARTTDQVRQQRLPIFNRVRARIVAIEGQKVEGEIGQQRCPSYFTSCSQPSPAGGSTVGVGWPRLVKKNSPRLIRLARSGTVRFAAPRARPSASARPAQWLPTCGTAARPTGG
jgi:hypothetical protein